jgi:uncharacterized protein YrzB (UPF0473 family)
MRFNKQSASDFGLISQDVNTATNPKDTSIWIKANLYDFGWGRENGYYRYPLPDFPTLLELALHSSNKEDAFGAASIILDQYPDELLDQCEKMMVDHGRQRDFKKMVELFKLKYTMNRCSTLQKPYNQVQDDFERWKKVSERANKV